MTRRLPKVAFEPDEKLWRHLAHGDLEKDDLGVVTIKTQRLRLQISVSRGSECAPDGPEHPPGVPESFNGLATIMAADARTKVGAVTSTCVDEPHDNYPPHALIVFFTDVDPATYSTEDEEAVRQILVSRFAIVRLPTKVKK